ncbi:MAG: V-type ATP synthase subunit I [Clostridiales bacterium]|nr:V-type ATP synthase subunit I [Clostridiales bacterium]
MAIVKMKRLKLAAVKSEREELLRQLMLLGCVEISEPEPTPEDSEYAGILKKEAAGAYERKSDYDELCWGVTLLDKYAPQKTKLLSPRSCVSRDSVMDESNLQRFLELAKRMNVTDDHIRTIEARQSNILGNLESLEPWKNMDVPLDLTETKTCCITPGMIPATVELDDAMRAMDGSGYEAGLFEISSDKDMHYVLLVAMKDRYQDVTELLRAFGFSAASTTNLHGTVQRNIDRMNAELEELENKKKLLAADIIAVAPVRDEMKLCADRMFTKLQRAESAERLLYTQSAYICEGWFPAEDEGRLNELLSRYDCAWETSDPDPEDYPTVPVKLKNNRITRPLNMVTDMYSLPAYDGLDPNPLMMPFFVLFYGIMMADMGYGLLMMLAGYIVTKVKKPRGTSRNLFELMFVCGISTFIWGAVTGGFFGDAPFQIAKIINPNTTFSGLPSLFTPLNDTLYVLLGSMILGLIQIITGMIISFVKKTKDGHFWDALMDEGSWWLVFIGIAVGALCGFWWIAIAGVAALICTQGRDKPTVAGKIVGGIASLYDITGYFGDILSYSRLMALMLAGSVIAQVFNTLGAIPGNIIFFLIVFVIGQSLNFGLNLLGCYVHDLRLQCLEYFGKFYKDGGRRFEPLAINTNYYDVVD